MKKQKSRVKVLMADDQPLVLEGLRHVLQEHSDLEIVGQALTGSQAVSLALLHKPDVVLMDIGMPELNGIGATTQILARLPTTRVIALSAHSNATMIRAMTRAGAQAYVVKDSVSSDIIDAIRTVLAGQKYFSASIVQRVYDDYCREERGDMPALSELTRAEREVLQMTVEDLPVKEIAAHLNLSVRAVETRRARLKSKLKVRSLVGLTKYALREGILSAEST